VSAGVLNVYTADYYDSWELYYHPDGFGVYGALQGGRSWVQFPLVSLEFFIDIILLAAIWPWG